MELDKGGVEDDLEMLLMYQYYPAPEIYHAQQLPDQQAALVREGKQRRRRRKKGGSGSGSGSGEGSGVSKRKLSEEQVKMLELQFGNEHKLVLERKETIAAELGLDPRQVAVWFQNRRARWKSKKLEEEYIKLKTEHETTVLEICRLQNEVLRLTQQLSEQEKKKQRLLEKCEGRSSNSSNTSSFSIEAMQPPSFGEFGMGGLESIFYLPENNYLY